LIFYFVFFSILCGQDYHPLITAMLLYCYFQPALLYIVPAAIGFLAAHVVWNGEVKPVCSLPSMTFFLLLALTIILFYFIF
jgi:minor histocompatibility antigen H13